MSGPNRDWLRITGKPKLTSGWSRRRNNSFQSKNHLPLRSMVTDPTNGLRDLLGFPELGSNWPIIESPLEILRGLPMKYGCRDHPLDADNLFRMQGFRQPIPFSLPVELLVIIAFLKK
jgi:hypothetical protein